MKFCLKGGDFEIQAGRFFRELFCPKIIRNFTVNMQIVQTLAMLSNFVIVKTSIDY